MKKFILILFLAIFSLSCAPMAEFIEYDIYAWHPFIYDEDVMIKDHFPPLILEKGESYVVYLGESIRTKRSSGETSIYVKEKVYPICGKVSVWNGTRIYLELSNPTGLEYKYHLIFDGKRYMQNTYTNEM